MWTSLKMFLQEINLGFLSMILILRSRFWNGKALEWKATEKESQDVKIKIKAILIALTIVGLWYKTGLLRARQLTLSITLV